MTTRSSSSVNAHNLPTFSLVCRPSGFMAGHYSEREWSSNGFGWRVGRASLRAASDQDRLVISLAPPKVRAFCSVGTIENSPAFQCRDRSRIDRVPAGRLTHPSNRPFGTCSDSVRCPPLKRRAIFKMSLRDRAFWLFKKSGLSRAAGV